MNWQEQFEIISKRIGNELAARHQKFSLRNAADFLGVGIGKVNAWSRGQRPSADDLETLARKLGFSPHWLLLREGEPLAQPAGPEIAASPAPPAAPGDPLVQQMEAFERLMRARNAPDEDVRDGLLALIRAHRPGYPTADVEERVRSYGDLKEAAEDPAAYPGKKSTG